MIELTNTTTAANALVASGDMSVDKLQLEVRALRAELDELRRVERFKDEQLTLATHELSTPLTAIKAYVEALAEHYGSPGFTQGPEFLEVLGRETSRLIRIVERTLEISRSAALAAAMRRCRVQLPQIVDEVAASLRPVMAERAMALDVRLAADLPPLDADPDLMKQVLINLIHNAVKFSPPGRKVFLAAAAGASDVVVQVRDEGFGIIPEELGRVFDPYFRSRDGRVERERGTGLGLTIVKTIVERHGGRVWVESRLDSGTIFHLSLPRA